MSLDKNQEVKFLGHMAALFLILDKFYSIFNRGCTNLHPINNAGEFPFLPLVVCGFINDGHSDRCEVTSHCGFNLHLSAD